MKWMHRKSEVIKQCVVVIIDMVGQVHQLVNFCNGIFNQTNWFYSQFFQLIAINRKIGNIFSKTSRIKQTFGLDDKKNNWWKCKNFHQFNVKCNLQKKKKKCCSTLGNTSFHYALHSSISRKISFLFDTYFFHKHQFYGYFSNSYFKLQYFQREVCYLLKNW